MKNVTTAKRDNYNIYIDEMLGVWAIDNKAGPYVDLYVEGADVPFDTVHVWHSGQGERFTAAEVKRAVLQRFKEGRRED